MANPYYDNIIKAYKVKDQPQSSRYKNLRRIIDDEGDEYVESYERIDIRTTSKDQYHTVDASEENRLDLISNKYYGTPLLYWIIAEANDIYDMFEVPTGTILRIPSKTSLYGYQGVLA